MDPESKKILQNTFALAEENNKMLHKIRRGQKWASFMRMVYWIVIIGISIGAFYVLEPYMTKMMQFIESTGITFDQIQNVIPKNISIPR